MGTIFAATWAYGEYVVKEAWRVWSSAFRQDIDQDLMDAVEAGTVLCEMDWRADTVGVGGLPNAIGETELDAAIMEGRFLNAGAVAGVKRFAPVVTLARRVMEQTPHVMLVAEGAERFAAQQGFEPRNLMSEHSLRSWYAWKSNQKHLVESSLTPSPYHESSDSLPSTPQEPPHDTMGVIGWHNGHLVAACSTSGMPWKLPGRVGDSPIFGAGLYADDEAGAAVATGLGEEIWRFTLCVRVVEAMRRGLSASESCREAIDFMVRRKPETAQMQAAVIGVRKDGDYGTGSTLPEFPAFFCRDGDVIEAK